MCLHSCWGRVMVGGGGEGGEWQLSAGKTNKLRATARAQSPGTLRNILSTGLPGSTPDTAPGIASLCSQITASAPRQGAVWPWGPRLCKGQITVFFLILSKQQRRGKIQGRIRIFKYLKGYSSDLVLHFHKVGELMHNSLKQYLSVEAEISVFYFLVSSKNVASYIYLVNTRLLISLPPVHNGDPLVKSLSPNWENSDDLIRFY